MNFLKNKRILITGACGTIGYELVRLLLQDDSYQPVEIGERRGASGNRLCRINYGEMFEQIMVYKKNIAKHRIFRGIKLD